MNKKITIKTPKTSKKQKSAEDWVSNRDGKKRLTIDIPASLHTKLKIASVKNSQSMSNLIQDCLIEHLKKP